jgi:hypothetical protein
MTPRKRGQQPKPPEERVIQFSIYPKSGNIDKLGRENAREIAEQAILAAVAKIK